MSDAITPTRIIPAGASLPARPADAQPPPPPQSAPPAPPAGPPPHQPGTPLVVHHVHEIVIVEPALPAPARRSWRWLTSRIRPFLTAAAAIVALTPWDHGISPPAGWSLTLHQAREISISGAYILAGGALGLAILIDAAGHHRPGLAGAIHRAIARGLLIITIVGGTGALNLYDPVTLITGVRP